MALEHYFCLLLFTTFSQNQSTFCYGFGFTFIPKRNNNSRKYPYAQPVCSAKHNGATSHFCSSHLCLPRFNKSAKRLPFSRNNDLVKSIQISVVTSAVLNAMNESSESDIKNNNDIRFVLKKFISRLVNHLSTKLQRFQVKIQKVYQGLQERVVSKNKLDMDGLKYISTRSEKEIDYELKVDTTTQVTDGNTQESEATSLVTPSQVVREHEYPVGPRWAISSNTTDLTGHWKPIVTTEFKEHYDEYLQNCSQSFLFRKLVTQTIGLTTERIYQENEGRNLTILGISPAGTWERTLVSSGSDYQYDTCCDDGDGNNDCWKPIHVEIKDPDGDLVQVESWWEDNGRLHKSWLRGKPRVFGGTFETTRYLEIDNPDVLICDSKFHPPPATTKGGKFRFGNIMWKFERCRDE